MTRFRSTLQRLKEIGQTPIFVGKPKPLLLRLRPETEWVLEKLSAAKGAPSRDEILDAAFGFWVSRQKPDLHRKMLEKFGHPTKKESK